MSETVGVRIDDAAMRAFLERLNEPGVRKLLNKALVAGAAPLRTTMRTQIRDKSRAAAGATGTYKTRRGKVVEYGKPGDMRRSVRVRAIRDMNTAGVVVAPMGKLAFMRHWVAYGTREHLIMPREIGGRLRTAFGWVSVVHHPGAQANDYVARTTAIAETAAVERTEQKLMDLAEALR